LDRMHREWNAEDAERRELYGNATYENDKKFGLSGEDGTGGPGTSFVSFAEI